MKTGAPVRACKCVTQGPSWWVVQRPLGQAQLVTGAAQGSQRSRTMTVPASHHPVTSARRCTCMEPRASQPQKTCPILPHSGPSHNPQVSPCWQAAVQLPSYSHSHQPLSASLDEEDFDQDIQRIVEQTNGSDESEAQHNRQFWPCPAFSSSQPSLCCSTVEPHLSAPQSVRSRESALHHGLPLHHLQD
jgi:hypothetical protein